MKMYIYTIMMSGIMLTACQPTSYPAVVDIEAETAAVNDVIDNITSSMKAQDVEKLITYFTEDILVVGSDPSEFWNKQQIYELWKKVLPQVTIEYETIGKRFIKVAPDGNSAFVIDQHYIPLFIKNIPFRNSYHLIKENKQWKVLLFNAALIPKNEELLKLDAAL